MPRAAKRPYPNRSDLVNEGALAMKAGPSQQYGERAQEQRAQNAIPMAPTPIAVGPAPHQQTAPQAPQGQPQQPVDLMGLAAAHAQNVPDMGALDRPTERPGEPVTHGLPNGPGGGPQVLTGVGAAAREQVIQQGTISNLLQHLAVQPNATSAVKALANTALGGVL